MGTKRYELAESEWNRIKDMLPPEHPKEGKRGRPAKCDNRTALNGMLWIARGGAPWRELPERYGPWQTVYSRFRKWKKMAAIKIRDGDEEWYIMPGGGQEAEETLQEAVCREVLEELGITVACRDLLFVIEGVHGESFHRVDLVFSVRLWKTFPMPFFTAIRTRLVRNGWI